VTIIDGLVKHTAYTGVEQYNPLAGMKGWAEKSVREYAMRCNWIVSVVDMVVKDKQI